MKLTIDTVFVIQKAIQQLKKRMFCVFLPLLWYLPYLLVVFELKRSKTLKKKQSGSFKMETIWANCITYKIVQRQVKGVRAGRKSHHAGLASARVFATSCSLNVTAFRQSNCQCTWHDRKGQFCELPKIKTMTIPYWEYNMKLCTVWVKFYSKLSLCWLDDRGGKNQVLALVDCKNLRWAHMLLAWIECC